LRGWTADPGLRAPANKSWWLYRINTLF